jgi:argininosuccinate lyase
LEEYQGLSDVIQKDLYPVLEPKEAVNRRTSFGGTAGANVEAALKEAKKRLWPK